MCQGTEVEDVEEGVACSDPAGPLYRKKGQTRAEARTPLFPNGMERGKDGEVDAMGFKGLMA